jgi:hypothetical protein
MGLDVDGGGTKAGISRDGGDREREGNLLLILGCSVGTIGAVAIGLDGPASLSESESESEEEEEEEESLEEEEDEATIRSSNKHFYRSSTITIRALTGRNRSCLFHRLSLDRYLYGLIIA